MEKARFCSNFAPENKKLLLATLTKSKLSKPWMFFDFSAQGQGDNIINLLIYLLFYFMLNSHLNTEKQDLLITSNLKPNQLPKLLNEALSVAPEGEMRDMLLLSLLSNIGYALPAMRMLHGRPHHTYCPELLTMIVAPAASGKGIMNYGRLLLQAIEGKNGKKVYIPANSSASALLKVMDEYDSTSPRPYIQETEATIITSRCSNRERVAEFRIRSICSFIAESFSIYVSVFGT